MPYEDLSGMEHRLTLDGRQRLVVTGVEEVERFDEEEVVMRTAAGVLVVGGASLHIGKLNLDGGELHVDGNIDTLAYEDAASARSSPPLGVWEIRTTSPMYPAFPAAPGGQGISSPSIIWLWSGTAPRKAGSTPS